MKAIDIKSIAYFDFKVECNDKKPKFIAGDHKHIKI